MSKNYLHFFVELKHLPEEDKEHKVISDFGCVIDILERSKNYDCEDWKVKLKKKWVSLDELKVSKNYGDVELLKNVSRGEICWQRWDQILRA